MLLAGKPASARRWPSCIGNCSPRHVERRVPRSSTQNAQVQLRAATDSSAPSIAGIKVETLHVAASSPPPDAKPAYTPPPLDTWGQDHLLMSGCETDKKLKVAVLLSGGVDSSLALRLLVSAGHSCRAFYLQIWFQEDFRNFWDACPWQEDLEYARQVCDSLGVPLEVVPLTDAYWDKVVSESVSEIRAGRTPNPDMLCNSRVKFGAFYDYLQQHSSSFDRVASGHYARVVRSTGPDGAEVAQLALTPDAVKDQTYFLAHLSQAQLSQAMFPLGGLTKPQVRALAEAAALATQARRDSQGICFLGKVKFGEFVKEHLGEWPGPIVEQETGKVIGVHQGYWFYTVGQRGGIKLPGGPWYVTAKDIAMNVVQVSREYYAGDKQRRAFEAGPYNWVAGMGPREELPLMVKVRHGPHMYGCTFTQLPGPQQRALVELDADDQGLAAGQYAVFYQEGVCLGSAKIQRCVQQ